MKLLDKLSNPWKPYPDNKPEKDGWYICSIRYGEEPGQAYVMDLYYDTRLNRWKDNRRLDVFNSYSVCCYNNETKRQDKNIINDNLCYRKDVIAFKRLPKIYK